jgi:predicted ABC-type ATPase
MSQIFVLAGPPGVGKSTAGFEFVDPDLEILNEDEMAFKYRTQGYPDYKEHAIHRFTQAIRTKLIRNEDIALELNLGYPEHYDYILSAKKFNSDNLLHIILFYTDDLQVCVERAKFRFESGRHLVTPETIREMYSNTLPLLHSNLKHIDSINFIDAGGAEPMPIAVYDHLKNELQIKEKECAWFNENVCPFINVT